MPTNHNDVIHLKESPYSATLQGQVLVLHETKVMKGMCSLKDWRI